MRDHEPIQPDGPEQRIKENRDGSATDPERGDQDENKDYGHNQRGPEDRKALLLMTGHREQWNYRTSRRTQQLCHKQDEHDIVPGDELGAEQSQQRRAKCGEAGNRSDAAPEAQLGGARHDGL